MKTVHLISNAHLDPVWQWEWQEGAAAAVSTFRAAADFCEEFDGYVFNHNEAILYQWVEEYEPSLFRRIQDLVRAGKWHIMGGWFLQPDCNMPSGESFVRQILAGRLYFRDTFGVKPTTAINFDSFGHTRGLVQIMEQAGYDSYLFMRPEDMRGLPAQDFVWEGYSGSKITAHHIRGGYSSQLGRAREKLESWLESHPDTEQGLVLWGVGNHGGGPSRADLRAIAELARERSDRVWVHSTPERYFAALRDGGPLPSYAGDLQPRFVGCYTSMIRVKMKHRKLENELFLTEKMAAAAAATGLLAYPSDGLREACRDLLTAQFHDILPGTSIQSVEEASLQLMDHGLEIASRLKARAFFALADGQPQAAPHEYPILVYNPHPYPVRQIVECEFMLEDPNWSETYSLPVVHQNGIPLNTQAEKESSNLNLDWRKRVAFEAVLAPSAMNRFDCRIVRADRKPAPVLELQGGAFVFETAELRVVINARTGLLDEYRANGISYLQPNAFEPIVMADNEDPWRMDTDAFDDPLGSFVLMEPGPGSEFSGVKTEGLPSVRVIEDGSVRTVIEAVLSYKDRSFICQTYKLPKKGTEIEVRVRTYWNEKDRMLKLSVPTRFNGGSYRGQTAFGIGELPEDGTEAVALRWVAVEEGGQALTILNDGIYGSDFREGMLRLSLLRGAGYCAHPIGDRPIQVQDRFLPRIDQGERCYTFWFNAGEREPRMAAVDREAMAKNEAPYALSFFPSGQGQTAGTFIELGDDVVQMTALKKAERDDRFVVRIFEPTGFPRTTQIRLPSWGINREVRLNGFEIRTFWLDPLRKELMEGTLCEDV